jgi:hypothetical protein
VGDPPGRKQQGAGRRIGRGILDGSGHREVTNVIERHHDDDEPAQDVQRRQPVRALIGGE